jgi:hypothetical protein
MSTDHITITVQDASTQTRARCEGWEGLAHLTFIEYGPGFGINDERTTDSPSFTPAGARSLAAVLNHLAEVAE